MGLAELQPLAIGGARLSLEERDGAWRLVFVGEIDMRDPSAVLLDYVLAVHDGLLAQGLHGLVVDFTLLRFMNSGGLKLLLTWFMRLKDLPPERRYDVRILHDPEVTWQSSSLPVLQKLLPDCIRVEGAP